jgi:hypothetical protein
MARRCNPLDVSPTTIKGIKMKDIELPDHIYQNIVDVSEFIYNFLLSLEDDGMDTKIIANAAIKVSAYYLSFELASKTEQEIDTYCKEVVEVFGKNIKAFAISMRNDIDSLNIP